MHSSWLIAAIVFVAPSALPSFAGTDGMVDLVLGYQFHEHFSFDVGMRWLDIDANGKQLDWTLRNL